MKKTSFTESFGTIEWRNSEILNEINPKAILRLKVSQSNNIISVGSATG
jgi:hypothetical protein